MNFNIPWIKIPRSVRINILDDYSLPESTVTHINRKLIEFKGRYLNNNTVEFETAAHYNWFLMRWS